jgi:UDP-N-acetylenolpyruvoylglucosamine reductase
VAEEDATASDIRALMELVRMKVAADSGVMLEPEVVVWGE